MSEMSQMSAVGAPPTTPGELPPEPTRWPTVLGPVSMVYAVGGLLCNVGGGLWMTLSELVPPMFRGGAVVPPVLRVVGGISAAIGLSLGILLLLGAVGLLRRRRSSVRMLYTWLAARLVLIVVGLAATIALMPAHVEMARSSEHWVEEQSAANPNFSASITPRTDEEIARQTLLFAAIGSVATAIYPIFIGFWLTRRKIREEIEAWD